jgi:protein-disulfide isomerase
MIGFTDRIGLLRPLTAATCLMLATTGATVRTADRSAATLQKRAAAISINGAPTIGDPAARLVLVEFSDFHCPFCRRHAREVLPLIKRDFVDSGKVLYVFRHFPMERTHPMAPTAAQAADCAARQDRFWEFHDRLFGAAGPVRSSELEKEAKAVRLDIGRFRDCMGGVAAADRVRQDLDDARHFGLRGTPGFVLAFRDGEGDPRVVTVLGGARPYSAWKELLDSAITELER